MEASGISLRALAATLVMVLPAGSVPGVGHEQAREIVVVGGGSTVAANDRAVAGGLGGATPPGPCLLGLPGYQLPVRATVIDPFRAPSSPWGAGNRGWELGTSGGETVCAVAAGSVTFAGEVAGRGVVTIRHGDGMLSSVTGLTEVWVRRGEPLEGGVPLGTARPGVHLGFRVDGRYIDPALVYHAPRHAVLVPLPVD